MASVADNTPTEPPPPPPLTATEQIRIRRSKPQQPTSPNPQISSLLQSTRCKPTISSLFLSTFTTNNNGSTSTNMGSSTDSPSLKHKKKNFSSATFRGLGCTTSAQVSAPAAAVIRSSADWQAKKVRRKKQRSPNRKKNLNQQTSTAAMSNPTPVVVVPDVWCTPGIGFSAEAASVDCVVSRRPVQGRGRPDAGDRVTHRERSCTVRRVNNLENISLLESPSDFETTRFGSDIYGSRHHRHFRHRSPGGFAEMMMFQSGLLVGGRSEGFDRYRDWRLDVDSMSYEELLELGDRIGCVSTGLREDEIIRCLRKTKRAILDTHSSHFPVEMEWKCSICQEEYEEDDEMGKLDCGHSFHIFCIKQWLLQKNTCPVCKVAASA